MRKILFGFFVLFFSFLLHSQGQIKSAVLKGNYFGQEAPGKTPRIFNTNIYDLKDVKAFPVFSKDNSRLIVSASDSSGKGVFYMEQIDGIWTKPVRTPFSSSYPEGHFLLSPDESRVIFTSKRPTGESAEESTNWNLWYVDRYENGWGIPTSYAYPVNTEMDEIYGTLTWENQLYFANLPPGEWDKADIVNAYYSKGNYLTIENLETVNTNLEEVDPYISPDESYLIFSSHRDGSLGQHDFFISFINDDDSWSEPIHLKNEINSEFNEVCPWVTLDGKYFFYISNKAGEYKPYWISAEFIQELNPLN